MDVSVIVVSFNTAHLLAEMMSALRVASTGLVVETVFVDNHSADTSATVIARDYSDCKFIVNPRNVGFGRANNQALPHISGRYVLLLNTDAFVAPDTLSKTVSYMDQNPQCGILGVRLEGRDGVLQPCARYFPTTVNAFLARIGLQRFFKRIQMVDDMDWDHRSIRHCDWVVGCYYLVRKEVIDQIGLFDPRYFLYYEEVDHCFAAKNAGWDVVFYPHTTVVHIGGESAKSEGAITQSGRQLQALQVESELLYFRKNHGLPLCLLHMALSFLADFILTTKFVVKALVYRKSLVGVGDPWRHTVLMSTLFFRTGWATRPTR
jgi:N-acetylglucosaminyl-diphospho-decaprenol L-rhamnosyltransferase